MPDTTGLLDVTFLSPSQERMFQRWAKNNKITDVDDPNSHYDYRGFWKAQGGPNIRFGVEHFPDTFKQRGHPTFSQESQYSRGLSEGGMWIPGTETLLQQPKMAVSHKLDVGPSKEFLKNKPWWQMRGEEREMRRLQPPRNVTGPRG